MKQHKLTASWWPPQDLQTFRLVKFFSLTSFVVILVFTVILTVLLTNRAERMALKKSQDYLKLLAANLNHQVFQQFLVPVAIEKEGKFNIGDPVINKRLDAVVRNTIHGFHVEQLVIYDQLGFLAYSTTETRLGRDSFDLPGVRQALFGEEFFELPSQYSLWSLLGQWAAGEPRLRAYFPFRLEPKEGPQLGPVVGVFEITQNISADLTEIGKFQLLILVTSFLTMGLLFVILRQIVKRAEVILEKRQEEQRNLEAQLHQAEKLAALGEMTAGVAHEIRNPLGIISSTAEFLRERLNQYEPQNRLAQIIVEEANRLNDKVTEFLDFARPRLPNLQDCNLTKVLDRSLEFLQPEIQRRQIDITRHYQDNGQLQRADPDLLHQAFLNILLNAIQAMPHGGHLTIATSLDSRGQISQIRFADTGEGIDPETLKKVFNPFFTTKEKGSGLGLPIVKSIMESHQGDVTIDSAPGSGTTVTIHLKPV